MTIKMKIVMIVMMNKVQETMIAMNELEIKKVVGEEEVEAKKGAKAKKEIRTQA